MKACSVLARLLLAVCALIWIQLPLARAADPSTTVTTDQEDYPPFSVVWITGAGFQSGETVSNQVVQVSGPDAGAAYEPWEVVADTNGNFTTSWYVFSDELFNTTLQLTSTGQSSGWIAQAIFADAFGISKLHLGNLAGAENYVFTVGDVIVAEGSVDPADGGHPNRHYRFIVRDPSGTIRNVPVCTANGAGGNVTGSYTVQAGDPVSAAAEWTFTLEQINSVDCSGTLELKTSSKAFDLAKATVYANSALTIQQSCLGAGATA